MMKTICYKKSYIQQYECQVTKTEYPLMVTYGQN